MSYCTSGECSRSCSCCTTVLHHMLLLTDCCLNVF